MVNGGRSLLLDACPRLPPGRRDLNQRASAVALKWTTRSYNVAGASAVAPRWQSFKQLTPRTRASLASFTFLARVCVTPTPALVCPDVRSLVAAKALVPLRDAKRIRFLCRAVLDSAAYIARASGAHGPLQSRPAHAAGKSVAFEMRSLRDKARLREQALTVCFGLAHGLIRVTSCTSFYYPTHSFAVIDMY